MPSVADNLAIWNGFDWREQGDEWSRWWGGTPAMWHGIVMPRIHPIVPTGSMLEIAPGFGRWTQFLKGLCDRLVVVDLTEKCIDHCRERFAAAGHIDYYVNDGLSLDMVADRSVDFVFSFDSLVHADPVVFEAYIPQLAAKLRPDGIGLIHHSNAGSLRAFTSASRRIPKRLLDASIRTGVAVNLVAGRDERMTAQIFRETCERSGLSCFAQELVSWEFGYYLLDCISMFTHPGSRWDRFPRVERNPLFAREARRMTRLYAYPGSRSGPSAPLV
jgi:hypothetical protein